MDNYRPPSRTQTNQKKALEDLKRLQEELNKAQEKFKKTTAATDLEKYIKTYMSRDNLTIEDIQDIVTGIKEDLEIDINDSQDEMGNNDENFQDVLETESLEVEIIDNAGPINEKECDEIIIEENKLVPKFYDKEYGEGPVRCQEISTNKYFHGVVEKDLKLKWNPKLHHFFQKVNGGKVWNKNWDTYLEPNKYCNNCRMIKKNKKTISYECLGH